MVDNKGQIRQFNTGATRDSDIGKLDYEGFYHPLIVERFAQYMNKHRVQSDGSLRDSDNWQKGIPLDAYIKSKMRHDVDLWFHHRGLADKARDTLEDCLCAILFNVQGYLLEVLKTKNSNTQVIKLTDKKEIQ